MALIPALLNEILSNEYRRPQTLADLYDQHFGLGLLNNEELAPTRVLLAPLRHGYVRPWRNLAAGDSGISQIHSDKNEFKVNLDVQQFKPEELKVRVENGFLVVDGKHEERSDEHGFISRQFTRRYQIPEDVDQQTLTSNLSSDGVLTLKATKKALPESQGKEIPITRTNEPAVKQKQPEKAEKMDQQ